MVGTPRPQPPSKTPFRWRVFDAMWGLAELAVIGLLWLALLLVGGVLIWVAIEGALPWVVGVVMDAVEQRD
jgi:hypothetical protein